MNTPVPLRKSYPHRNRPTRDPLRPIALPTPDSAMRSLARATVVAGLGAINRSLLVGEYAARQWPEDACVPLVLRSAGSLATIANTPALTVIGQSFLAALVAQSGGADLLQRGLSLQFDGAAAIHVPGIAIPTADFVAEGAAIPATEAPTSTDAWLERRKLAIIASATSELLRSPSAEQLIRQVLVEATGPALDRALFSTAAGDDTRPAGLRHNIAALPPAANLVDALVAVLETIAPVSGNGAVAVITTPKLRVAIDLLLPRQPPFVVLASSSLPTGTIIAVALNGLVSAVEGPPEIDASSDALVHEESGPSWNIGGGVMAHPLRSFFQSDTVGLRLRWPISWALRDARAIAWTEL